MNTLKNNKVVDSLVDFFELKKYEITWNEGERSIPQIWSVYPPRRFVHFALLSMYEFVANHYTKNKVVLDFGCGVGYGSYRLGVRGASFVHGIELDNKAVNFGRDYYHYPNVKIENIDINDLADDFEKIGTYDFIYCSNVMEHIEDYKTVLRSIQSLLKPGGKYFQATPPSGKPRGNPFHVTNFTVPEWAIILEQFFSKQHYFAHRPRRSREDVISEYEFDFIECGSLDMGSLQSISGIILATK